MSAQGPLGPDSLVPAAARTHQGRPAGFVSRCAAALVDLGVVVLILGLGYAGWSLARFVVAPEDFSFPAPSTAAQLLAYEVVAVGYLTTAWAALGCSQGQQVLGLRVTGRGGRAPGFVQAFLRALLCVTFPVSLLWVPFNHRRQALHDVVLRTSVTYAWAPLHP